MFRIILLFFAPLLLSTNTPSTGFSVKLKLTKISREEIHIQTEVETGGSVIIPRNRVVAFKTNKGSFNGNYILEFEKKNGRYYQLMEKNTQDIPNHIITEYISSGNGLLVDMLRIPAYYFASPQPSQFFPGTYRVRVSFNASETSSAQVNNSEWVEFVIQ